MLAPSGRFAKIDQQLEQVGCCKPSCPGKPPRKPAAGPWPTVLHIQSGKHYIQPGISALGAPQLPPAPAPTAIATAFVGCHAIRAPELSALPRAAQEASASISACVTATSTEAAPSCSSSRAWAGCGRCWPCRRAAPPPCPARPRVADWMVTLRSPWRSLGAHGVLGRGARLPGPPLGRFAVRGPPAARRGAAARSSRPAAAR